jgi:DNA-binding SARP family transcriptional activator
MTSDLDGAPPIAGTVSTIVDGQQVTSPPLLGFRVLGPVCVVRADAPIRLGGPKPRTVLAMLLAPAGERVTDGELIEGLWGERSPPAARGTLQSHVSNLRAALGDTVVVRDGGGYRVTVAPGQVDARCFEATLAAARGSATAEPAAAADELRQALALWRGHPFGDVIDTPRIAAEIRRLQELRVSAIEDRIAADLAMGRHDELIGQLEALTIEHPLRERMRAHHMLALYRSGRQGEALRAFERTRETLAEELGIDPSPALRDLHGRILRQDTSLELHEGGTPWQRAARPRRAGCGPVARAGADRAVRGYELRERIGGGDGSSVYRAYQPSVGREVALRVVHPEDVAEPAFLRRFEAETQRVAQLEHPHLVGLLDAWRDPDGAYLVMPWLGGGSLQGTLTRGPWDPAPTARLLTQVGAALAHAHRHGVSHRHLTSSSILLDEDGNAYVADLAVGLWRPVRPGAERGEALTAASDVHALGLIVFELLSGHRAPTEGPLPSLHEQRPELPAAIDEELLRATATDPSARHPAVGDLVGTLLDLLGTPIEAPPSHTPARNPYKGLCAFGEADDRDFYGRTALVEELVQAVAASRLVAVVGPSGVGKSSVVRAGLVPAIRSGALEGSPSWLVTEMFPGTHPFEELDAALRRVAVEGPAGWLESLTADEHGLVAATGRLLPPDGELVLVIDQFEELFTLSTDEVRERFLRALVAAATDRRSRIRVVLTLRADLFDRPLRHPAFARLLRAGMVTVTAPTTEELTDAVACPAEAVGVGFESGLVDHILQDVHEQPGALPLLQYALTELFAERTSDLLTLEGYRATGGVIGALARRAEELFEQLEPSAQKVVRQVFLRLVAVDESRTDTRRRVRRSELGDLAVPAGTLDEVLDGYGDHRLLTFDHDPVTRGPTVEVAHEALLDTWDRLRLWVDERRDDLVLRRRIGDAAGEWDDADRDPSYLLQGGRLDHVVRWAAATDLQLTGRERDYLDASQAAEE